MTTVNVFATYTDPGVNVSAWGWGALSCFAVFAVWLFLACGRGLRA